MSSLRVLGDRAWVRRDGDGPNMWGRTVFVHRLPRPVLRCRLHGHSPVVAGFDATYGGERVRWVECARCGVRPAGQGTLHPDDWPVGRPYTGPWVTAAEREQLTAELAHVRLDDVERMVDERHPASRPALPWPSPTFDAHVEAHVRRPSFSALSYQSVQLRIGGDSNENTIKAHLVLGVAAVYVSFGSLSKGLWRWTGNPIGDTWRPPRTFQLARAGGRIYWQLGNPRAHSHNSGDPRRWWGSLPVGDKLLGKATGVTEVLAVEQGVPIPMPERAYTATVQLERFTRRRPRGRTQVTYGAGVRMDDGEQIPDPGNLDSDFWDGEDATSSLTVLLSRDEATAADWLSPAVGKTVDRMLHQRARHTRGRGVDWRPKAKTAST